MRIPLNTFAIGFGLAGLGEIWQAACTAFGWPTIVCLLFWIPTAVAWVWLIVAHLVRGAHSNESLASQLRHPAQGPIAALAPVTGMLLAAEVGTISATAGDVFYFAMLAVSALFAGWILAFWLRGGLDIDAVHGGYLLPTVAAGLVGADVAARLGFEVLGWALFGVGAFFSIIMTLLVVARLMFRPSLPDPLVPTIMILLAPPGVAGVAWFALVGQRLDIGAAIIAALGVLLALVELALLPRYRKLSFSLGFWSFSFPVAAVVADAMMWMHLLAFPGWQFLDAVLLAGVTILIGWIGVRSLMAVSSRRAERASEAILRRADNSVEHA